MKKEIMVAVVGLGLMVAGCATTTNDRFDGRGLPRGRYFVGGGLEIVYVAPCKGTAYLVDWSKGEYIKTQSLDKNESFGMPDNLALAEVFAKFHGATPPINATLDLRLYFIPDETAPAPE